MNTNTRSSSPLRHLDLSDDTVAADMVAEKARELVNAYDRIENLQDAIRGLLDWVQIIAGRLDVSPAVREEITTNHRVIDAVELLR